LYRDGERVIFGCYDHVEFLGIFNGSPIWGLKAARLTISKETERRAELRRISKAKIEMLRSVVRTGIADKTGTSVELVTDHDVDVWMAAHSLLTANLRRHVDRKFGAVESQATAPKEPHKPQVTPAAVPEATRPQFSNPPRQVQTSDKHRATNVRAIDQPSRQVSAEPTAVDKVQNKAAEELALT
jgi:hypothetical protein